MPDASDQLPYDIEAGDEVPSNRCSNPRFAEVTEAGLGRRGILMGGLGAAIAGFIGAGADPAAVRVPPYQPDLPESRKDIARAIKAVADQQGGGEAALAEAAAETA